MLTLDVVKEAPWNEARRLAEARIGPIAMLCNNAAVASARQPITGMSVAAWQRALAVNLPGTFLGARTFTPGMVARGSGYLLNVASIGGLLAHVQGGDKTSHGNASDRHRARYRRHAGGRILAVH